jgi:hypothetical protein
VTLRFAETVKSTAPHLVLSRRHEDWVGLHDHPIYSTAALQFARNALTYVDRIRKGTVSASSLGECAREQQFTYIGLSKLPFDAKNAAKVANGSFMHLRWQMEGLTEGWLAQAEVPVRSDRYGLTGTMDGVLYEGSILELKSINNNGFGRVAAFGPLIPHLFQMATYMLCTSRDKGVFLYENKDTQEYTELVVTPDDLPMAEVRARADEVWDAISHKTLFEPLEKCIDREGWKYNSCPYRDRCLSIHTWEEADGSGSGL